MGDLKLERVSTLVEADIAECDFSFKICAEVAKPITQLALEQNFTTSPLPERTKDFGFDPGDFTGADGKKNVILVLKKDEKIFGLATASKGWNNMVHLNYIGLDVGIRGAGNAQRLLNAVLDWTHEIGLGGATNRVPV
jgi:GNAT superfamily N-acetyltransferase